MQSNSRWWEFYFVRYTLGTLLGAVIVHVLSNSNEKLKKILFFAAVDGKESIAGVSTLGIPLLLCYGLAFCYVASIPILVLHTGRMALWGLRNDSKTKDPFDFLGRIVRSDRLIVRIAAVMVAVALIVVCGQVAIIAFVFLERMLTIDDDFNMFLFYCAFLVIFIEFFFVLLIFFRKNKIYSNMRLLADARDHNKNKGEFIDSYRHLREHGNSILILVLEVVLGASLLGIAYWTTGNKAPEHQIGFIGAASLALLTLWTIPGACVWMFASWIEARFACEDQQNN